MYFDGFLKIDKNRFILFETTISKSDFSTKNFTFLFGPKVCCGFFVEVYDAFGIKLIARLSSALEPARHSMSVKFLNTVYVLV